MAFTDLLFPFVFLPVCLLLYYLLPMACRNPVLLIASLVFFAWGRPVYLILLVLEILLNYFAGREIEALLENGKTGHARLVLVLTVLADLVPLLFFKYYDAAASALDRMLFLGLPLHGQATPVGVSFYTFTLLSALSDVYHGRAPMEKNLVRFALFVSFFPKLTSGPIVQYAEMQPQLQPHQFVWERVGSGMRLFVIGLAKKVLLAGLLGTPFYALKALGPETLSVCGAWLGTLLYTLMLYFDFSGYSDMAIGAAKMFGFEFLANFDYPYCADSVASFWRRWHMSLGFWFRTYVYIPLGGSWYGAGRTIVNLLIVWGLTGIWHGADATFLVWGLYYGLLLILEKFVLRDILAKIPAFLRRIGTFFLVMLGWVPFFTDSLAEAGEWLGRMFYAGSAGVLDQTARFYFRTSWPVLLIALFAALPYGCRLGNRFYRMGRTASVLSSVYFIVLLVLCVAGMVSGTYSSFLYAQF